MASIDDYLITILKTPQVTAIQVIRFSVKGLLGIVDFPQTSFQLLNTHLFFQRNGILLSFTLIFQLKILDIPAKMLLESLNVALACNVPLYVACLSSSAVLILILGLFLHHLFFIFYNFIPKDILLID